MEENMKKEEDNIIHYRKTIHGCTYIGLMDKRTGEIIIEASEENGFTYLVPSRRNAQVDLPFVATFNKLENNEYVKGVIEIHGINQWEIISPDIHLYNYIGGFEGGLARINQFINGEKKWGIIGLRMINKQWQTDVLVEPCFDYMWDFYDKERTSIPVQKGFYTNDLSLVDIRNSFYNNKKYHNYSCRGTYRNLETTTEETRHENIQEKNLENLQETTSMPNTQSFIGEIEVKNFKRFSESASIDLSNRITFLVGKNNAGKSSLLDAVEMCTDTMYNMRLTMEGKPYFLFNRENRYLDYQKEMVKQYRNSKSSSLEPIVISLIAGQWKFEFMINNDALIETIQISKPENKSKIILCKEFVEVTFDDVPSIKYLKAIINDETKYDFEETQGLDILLTPIWEIIANDSRLSIDQKIKANEMRMSIDDSITTSNGIVRLPVFASVGKKTYQKELLNKEENVSSSIIDFFQINRKEKYHQFVCKWLYRLDMGDDFEITKNSLDKSYEMKILNNDGSSTDLCNMGSGTIHFIALCFKLLSIVERYKGNRYTPTILIEEPEQNLHPMLQSHMANFLLDVSDLYAETFDEGSLGRKMGLKMVVETHSEYIIRRSQVMAKRFVQRNQDIPFRVFYFPSDNKPYDMVYREDGKFENEFGEGFTDESTMLSYQLI